MVGSGTQLNSKNAPGEQPAPALATFNAEAKKGVRGASHQGTAAAGGFKSATMAEAQSTNEDKPPRADRQRLPGSIGTPSNGARFAQNGPVKATTMMFQGVASVTDKSSMPQGKLGASSPFTVEKKVADIAGLLQMRAPTKDVL